MAKTRRSFSDEDKAKIVAYVAEHGLKVATEHFNIVDSVIRRWLKKSAPRKKGEWREKKWTAEKIARVLDYLKTHSNAETIRHFKISSSQISLWRRGLTYLPKAKHKANGAATNGLGELPYQDALMWLGRWRQAYFDQLKAETPSAESVLDALRGGK